MQKQYPSYPYPIQPQFQPQPEEQSDNKKLYLIIGIAVIAILIVGFLVYRSFKQPIAPEKPVCGNGKCEENENCYDCAPDCKCKANEYCSEDAKKCLVPVCGNDKCEPFESGANCCDDCPCGLSQEVCNEETHECELPQISVSDERVDELARKYFEDQGQVIVSVGEVKPYVYQEKVCKAVEISLEGEEGRIHLIVVTENEEVIEVPIFGSIR